MDKCPFCGNAVEEGSKFCGSCGHPLTNTEPAEPTDTPAETVEAPVAPTEAPAAPTEASAAPTEAPAAPTEAPAAPTEAPAAPTEAPVAPTEAPIEPAATYQQPPMTPAQPPQSPMYNAPQQYAQGGVMTQTAVKKNKKGMVMAIIIGALMVLGIIAAVIVFKSGGSEHTLDGEYKLTGLKMGEQDYSYYIGYLDDSYNLIVEGSDITIESPGYTTSAKIDQKNHTISSGEFGTVDFTVDGNDITLNLNSEYTMTFTRQ